MKIINISAIQNFLKNLAIFCLACIISVILAEIIVRLIYMDETVLFPRYHTDAQYGAFTLRKIRPNTEFRHTSPDGSWKFTINNQGFRNYKNFDYKKSPGKIRIITLGDSHTQGYEVRQEYTFSAILEKYLNRHGINSEVINTGISGFSTAEELVYLENEGVKYHPDFVVLAFYANDYQDNIKAGIFRIGGDGKLNIQKKEHIPGVKIQNIIYSIPLIKWLGENSYFYSMLFNSVWAFFKTRLARQSAQEVLEYAVPTTDEFSDYQTELAVALITRMYQFCDKNRIKLLIIDIPTKQAGNSIGSSFNEILLKTVRRYSHAYITSDSLLKPFIGLKELHRPHGHGHISEFTHAKFGKALGMIIIEQLKEKEYN